MSRSRQAQASETRPERPISTAHRDMAPSSARPLGSADREHLGDRKIVIGIDEVGRGALAGPVVVGAAAFDHIPKNPDIQDSKIVPPRRRELAAAWVRANSVRWSVVEVWVELIDRVNILGATRLAMSAAARTLVRASPSDHLVIVDGVDLKDSAFSNIAEPGADARYFCVAAASILAKVHRDRLMADLASVYQHWEWQSNKGYGTVAHRRACGRHGVTFLHRRSFHFKPVAPGDSASGIAGLGDKDCFAMKPVLPYGLRSFPGRG